MAKVNLSLDTETKQIAMIIDGELQSFDSVHLSKFTFSDGEEFMSFSFVTSVINNNGLQEERRFFMPIDSGTMSKLQSSADPLTQKKFEEFGFTQDHPKGPFELESLQFDAKKGGLAFVVLDDNNVKLNIMDYLKSQCS